MGKVVNFFKKLKPSKRKLIQLYAALLYNAQIKGFINGKIYTGKLKNACLPGMNCYSCPGAVGACPLGSLQNSLSESKTKAPTYVIGIILLYCITLGRTICGYLCPAGFLQELLYKIKTPKLKKSKVTRVLSYLKYVLLFVLVIFVPLMYGLQAMSIPLPGFCKYICPVGTFEGAIFLLSNPKNSGYFGMLGPLFTWKFALLVGFILASIFIFRFFCRFFCPLGALYGLFNKISIIGIKVDKSKCNSCGACVSKCKMDTKYVGDHECINCGECIDVCHSCAISWKTIGPLVRRDIEADITIESAKVLNASTAESQEENTNVIKEETPSKKKKMSNRTIVNLVSFIIAMIVLIITYVYVNVDTTKKRYGLNDICSNYSIKLTEGNKYNTKNNDKKTIFYFYDKHNDEDFERLNSYADDDVNVVVVSLFENKDDEVDHTKYDKLIFGYDSVNNTSLQSFTKELTYPYFVLLDNKDKVVASQVGIVTSIQYETLMGGNVGTNVGDIIMNYSVSVIGSDEKYNVYDHLGQIQVINFWGTWCTPCCEELRDGIFNDAVLNNDDVYCIALHSQNDIGKAEDYVNTNYSTYEMKFGLDTNDDVYNSLIDDATWPWTVVIDKNGIIISKKNGPFANSQELQTIIDSCR